MENLIPLVVGLARPNIPATDASLAQLAHAARVNCDGSSIAGESVCSISEIRTQMSEAFWRYGRPDDALNVLQGFETDPRKTYPGEEITQPNFFSNGACLHWGFGAALLTSVALPAVGVNAEVSFTMVENCVAGLLGLAPNSLEHTLRTRHRLPTYMR
jgi:hypothetical protein